jgi:26S proteasome regulatory subunit N4
MEEAKKLMNEKASIEAQLDNYLQILKGAGIKQSTSLVDAEGFPRSDVDLYQITEAKQKVVMLRNDLDRLIEEIKLKLESIHEQARLSKESQ